MSDAPFLPPFHLAQLASFLSALYPFPAAGLLLLANGVVGVLG